MRTSSHLYTKRVDLTPGLLPCIVQTFFMIIIDSIALKLWGEPIDIYCIDWKNWDIKEVFYDFPNVISQMHQWALWNITYTAPILDIVSNEKKLIKPGESVRHELWVLFFSFFNWTLRVQNAGTSLFRSRSLSLLMRLFIKIVSVRCGCVQHWGKCLYRYTLRGVRWNCTHFGLLNLFNKNKT